MLVFFAGHVETFFRGCLLVGLFRYHAWDLFTFACFKLVVLWTSVLVFKDCLRIDIVIMIHYLGKTEETCSSFFFFSGTKIGKCYIADLAPKLMATFFFPKNVVGYLC